MLAHTICFAGAHQCGTNITAGTTFHQVHMQGWGPSGPKVKNPGLELRGSTLPPPQLCAGQTLAGTKGANFFCIEAWEGWFTFEVVKGAK